MLDIFDILGPVMIGPSSSHTAGAARIGFIARALLGTPPVKAAIHLYGSFAETGAGHGTDRALVGGLLGFLLYNHYPAKVFMGDTGSLTIGGIIAVGAIIIHKELMLPILCGIFFVESLSVMMQVYYYKIGKRRGVKQRIFKRTPIHDNFRTQDSQLDPDCKYLWKKPRNCFHESKITIRFWIVTIILAALTIITLKIR